MTTESELTEGLAGLRARFAAALDGKIGESFVALQEISGGGEMAETIVVAHRRLHEICGLAPTLGFAAIGKAGYEETYPDLISTTDAGYPFCRSVARWAQALGAQALHSKSARRHEGACVPVFVRECISDGEYIERYRFVARGGNIECERI